MRKVRKALLNSLALNLIVRGKIKTTEPKAKELRPLMEKLVTSAKSSDLATRRLIISRLSNKKNKDRKGGYTRILKLGRRVSDGAKMAIIEFV